MALAQNEHQRLPGLGDQAQSQHAFGGVESGQRIAHVHHRGNGVELDGFQRVAHHLQARGIGVHIARLEVVFHHQETENAHRILVARLPIQVVSQGIEGFVVRFLVALGVSQRATAADQFAYLLGQVLQDLRVCHLCHCCPLPACVCPLNWCRGEVGDAWEEGRFKEFF